MSLNYDKYLLLSHTSPVDKHSRSEILPNLPFSKSNANMPHDLDLTIKSSSLPKTYFLPSDGSAPNDVLVMVLLMPLAKHETGRHDGKRGKWVFLPGTETLDSLEKYRVDKNVRSRGRSHQDEPRRLLEDEPSKPKPRKSTASPEKDTLEHSGRQLERDMRALRRKERDLEREKQNLVKSSYAHEEKARDIRKAITRARTQSPDPNAKSLRDRDDSREQNKKRR